MQLLLFDIDGTLIDTGGAGLGALEAGMRIAFPRETAGEEMPPLDLAGATDSGVSRYLFKAFEVRHTPENEDAFFAAYIDVLKSRLLGQTPPPGRVLTGIAALLKALQRQQETKVALSLLTGNTRSGAEVKTTAYGLHSFFDFDCGAYGCDHWDRNQLGSVAVKRASKRHGHAIPQDRVTIIGDTPKDIACGKAIGARTVAVSTGSYDREALATWKPDHLLDDFSDVPAVLTLLLSGDNHSK